MKPFLLTTDRRIPGPDANFFAISASRVFSSAPVRRKLSALSPLQLSVDQPKPVPGQGLAPAGEFVTVF